MHAPPSDLEIEETKRRKIEKADEERRRDAVYDSAIETVIEKVDNESILCDITHALDKPSDSDGYTMLKDIVLSVKDPRIISTIWF